LTPKWLFGSNPHVFRESLDEMGQKSLDEMGQNAACSENPKIVGMAGCVSLQIWCENVCHPHIRE